MVAPLLAFLLGAQTAFLFVLVVLAIRDARWRQQWALYLREPPNWRQRLAQWSTHAPRGRTHP